MTAHQEPAIVDVGFSHNKRGGWWYREPQNRYTVQIVPSGKERRGWTLGIAHGGPIQWGKKAYPSPEAAAFLACRVVEDNALADRIAEAMRARQEERMQEITARIRRLKEGNR